MLTCIKSCIIAALWATSPFSHYNVLPLWWIGTSFSLVLAKRNDFVLKELVLGGRWGVVCVRVSEIQNGGTVEAEGKRHFLN